MKYLNLLLILLLCSCNDATEQDAVIAKETSYFEAVAKNDIKLAPPKPGDWLYHHKETPQSYEAYKSAQPKILTDSQNIIYLKPIGTFTSLQQRALELTRQYLAAFFQTKTILLAPATDSLVPDHCKRLRLDSSVQLLAPYILDTMLQGQSPKDAIAYMAFTAKDLYPQESWNFVFGMASYSKRVGVSSIYRLQNKKLDSANFALCLKRLMNVSSHEIGHMFTISHCTFAECVMNGSNNLPETDLQPNRLCAECSKKLFWNIRFDNKKRLAELCNFMLANKLTKDHQLLLADQKSVEEQ